MNTANAYKIALQGTLFLLVSAGLILLVADGQLFLSRPIASIYLALWFVWWVLTFTLRPTGIESETNRKGHNLVTAVTIAQLLALIVAVPWEYMHFDGPLPRDGWLAWLGLVVFAVGILLQTAAMWSMSGRYTTRLGIQPGHSLKTDGLYGWVRHPGYLSNLLELLGIALAMSSLFGLAVLAGSVVVVVERIKTEEGMLVETFGKEYESYRGRTRWKLFPGIY